MYREIRIQLKLYFCYCEATEMRLLQLESCYINYSNAKNFVNIMTDLIDQIWFLSRIINSEMDNSYY